MQTFYLFTILCHHENVTSRSVGAFVCHHPQCLIFYYNRTIFSNSEELLNTKVLVRKRLRLLFPEIFTYLLIFLLFMFGVLFFIRKLEELLLLQDHVKLQTKYHNCKTHTSKQIELGHPVSFPFLVQHPKGRL